MYIIVYEYVVWRPLGCYLLIYSKYTDYMLNAL